MGAERQSATTRHTLTIMIPKIPNSRFTGDNGVKYNGLYLLRNVSHPPFIAPAIGWEYSGHGLAPYGDGSAIMLRRTTASTQSDIAGDDVEPGKEFWHHINEDMLNSIIKHHAP